MKKLALVVLVFGAGYLVVAEEPKDRVSTIGNVLLQVIGSQRDLNIYLVTKDAYLEARIEALEGKNRISQN